MDKIGYLRETDIFSGLSVAEMDEMGVAFQMANFPKGKVIYQPYDPGDILFILKKGRVRIYRLSPEGRELTLSVLSSGTIFGEMALFGQTMYGSFAQAVEDCMVCVTNRKSATQMLKDNPNVAIRLVEIVGQRLLAAENRLESLGLMDVPHRLASLILEMAGASDGTAIGHRYTHEELAKMIGASRESVTLALSDFRNRGWISISDHQITLADPDALRAYAGI